MVTAMQWFYWTLWAAGLVHVLVGVVVPALRRARNRGDREVAGADATSRD